MKYQQIGNILIFNQLGKKEAKEILKTSKIKTVCIRTGAIKGKLRKPQIKVLASRIKSKRKQTETIHKENGILYKLDVAKLMFAKGNIRERHRIAKLAQGKETVIDMFAGIGYFSLPLARVVKKVYAIELNPTAYRYLQENIKLNKLDKKKIKAVKGDCNKIVPRLKIKANRIIMGYLPDAFPYLDSAFRVARKGTIIHYSCLISKKDKDSAINELVDKISSVASKYKFKIELIRTVLAKSYSPSQDHYVLDLKCFR